MALMRCVLCCGFAGNITKDKDWICDSCIRKYVGFGKWMIMREMSHVEIMRLKELPVKTKILDHGGGVISVKNSSGIGAASVGFLSGGIIGALAASVASNFVDNKTKRNDYTMFQVWNSDGSTAIEKIPHTSYLYEKYLLLMDN